MATRRPSIITLSDIPTVSQLYDSGDIQPMTGIESSFTPSSTLNAKVALIRTSITDLEVTSIVNAANTSLLGGGGVDGAIHAAAGPELLDECETLGGCETGSAKITLAYELPSKYVIHAVGPIYSVERRKREGSQAELLASCYRTSLELAAEKGGSVAFSCLSTGVYGYPSGEAAVIACKTVRDFLESEHGSRLERVVFCCFLEKDEIQYEECLPLIFPQSQGNLHSSEHEQGVPVKNSDAPEHDGLLSSATGVPEPEEWVTVENTSAMTDTNHVPVSEDAELEEPGSPARQETVAKESHAAAEKIVDEQHAQNGLLKDW